MPTIQKPALRDLYTQVVHDARQDPSKRVGNAAIDRLVAILGERRLFGLPIASTNAIEQRIGSGTLTSEDKLAIARKGLSPKERADIEAMLADAEFVAILEPDALRFLQGVVAAPEDAMEVAGLRADAASPEVQAAAKMRELVKSGELKKYYDAVIGAVDDPALKADAEALFAALPTVKPGMSADQLVRAGLWTVAPRGVEAMQKSARYLPGRQVLVKVPVFAKVPARTDPTFDTERKKIGAYDPTSPVSAITHRAVLLGDDPANEGQFLVSVDGVDGTPATLSVPKQTVFELNQRHELGAHYIHSDTKRDLPYGGAPWNIDYASPLAKAKLCEIALKLDEHVQKLDFTKAQTDAGGGMLSVFRRGNDSQAMVEVQKRCVDVVFRSIDMLYPKVEATQAVKGRCRSSERDAARQGIRGIGMCVQQSSVFGAYMMPFFNLLGVDGQYRTGPCFRTIKGPSDNVFGPGAAAGHGWWQLTFRPTMEMTVTDRTWNQVNLPLDRAYGFPYGDRYGSGVVPGFSIAPVDDTDVNVSGNVTVATMERQFSQAGDGRENHISNTQPQS